MAIYRGVVRGQTIVLDEPTGLPDGAEVQLAITEADRKAALLQRLRDTGVIAPRSLEPIKPVPAFDRLQFDGEPVSETIIRERR